MCVLILLFPKSAKKMNTNYLIKMIRIVKSNQILCRMGSRQLSSQTKRLDLNEEQEFPVLNILPYNRVKREKRVFSRPDIMSPRYKRLSEKQEWSNVWPASRTFHPATVPLPLHMNYIDDIKPAPPIGKFNNPELLKIPNFLHLTPPAVKKHCDALRKFCTKWPEALKTDEDCRKHFPLSILTKDFVFSGPSIRWPEARIVELSLKISDLKLDEHASDKLKRLLRHRYNSETDLITIRVDSCPVRKQNYEYGKYLLTAAYFESWKTEPWESEKEYSDWERYFWSKSKSKQSINEYLRQVDPENYSNDADVEGNEKVKKYAKAVTELYDRKESAETLSNYKQSVLNILF